MIDVQVVAYGGGADLRRAIASARAIPEVRVVVVDHLGDVGSDVGADVVVADVSNPGFGAGHNRALALGTAPWVLLLNPDSEVDADAIAAGVALLEAEPRVAMVQGVVVGLDGTPDRSGGIEITPVHLLARAFALRPLLRHASLRRLAARSRLLADHADRTPQAPRDVESIAATAVLARRSALESVGGFDGSYFLYGEDLDLCRRLRQAGWRLVSIPGRWAIHAGGGTSATRWDRELRWWEGTLRFAAQWWSTTSWIVGQLAAFAIVVRLAVRRPGSLRLLLRTLVREPRRVRRSRRQR